jgi:hypothetical protein
MICLATGAKKATAMQNPVTKSSPMNFRICIKRECKTEDAQTEIRCNFEYARWKER